MNNLTDPITGASYTIKVQLRDSNCEIDILDRDMPVANVFIEVYDGRSQVVIADKKSIEETGGDDPQIVSLFQIPDSL